MHNRREFIGFLGKATLGSAILPPFLSSCGSTTTPSESFGSINQENLEHLRSVILEGLSASDQDDLLLANGLNYQPVIKWGDKISAVDSFGFNNDFTCFIPLDESNPKDGLLWVNHEYINPLFVSNFDFAAYDDPREHRTKEQVDKEMYAVGGSIVRIKEENGKWGIVENDPYNRRITAQTPIQVPRRRNKSARSSRVRCSGQTQLSLRPKSRRLGRRLKTDRR